MKTLWEVQILDDESRPYPFPTKESACLFAANHSIKFPVEVRDPEGRVVAKFKVDKYTRKNPPKARLNRERIQEQLDKARAARKVTKPAPAKPLKKSKPLKKKVKG